MAHPLHSLATTRMIESGAALALEPHTLMRRAGTAVARLAMATFPHARRPWVACGPGTNGGDGLEAAAFLRGRGLAPVVTWMGTPDSCPSDARASWQRAVAAGVEFVDAPPEDFDLCIDALLGIGGRSIVTGKAAEWTERINASGVAVIAVDVPSGLNAFTGAGEASGSMVRATHTLSLLTLKPGLFTAMGRDVCGSVWLETLGVEPDASPFAHLSPAPMPPEPAHASHKGSFGDVAIIGGAEGMTGAALLAGSAALYSGAGRVFVGLLDNALRVAESLPELMFRDPSRLDFSTMAVACGCGGGDAVRGLLPRVLSSARALVLDADALNAVAADPQLAALLAARGRRGVPTVITPHPLEAARLLGITTADVQADRISGALQLSERFSCVVVLKGSGTVIAGGCGTGGDDAGDGAPGPIHINPTGNARLATAGTGDVLAGMIAARLAAGRDPFTSASDAVYQHGLVAQEWPGFLSTEVALTASLLAAALSR